METTIFSESDNQGWTRERSVEELRGYVTKRLTSLPDFELE